MFLLPLMSASLTVYTYSSETPLKQVDINLPCSIGKVRITAEAEMDEEDNIILDSLRITDLKNSELLSDTGEVIELPRLCNKDYNEAVFLASKLVAEYGLKTLPIEYL